MENNRKTLALPVVTVVLSMSMLLSVLMPVCVGRVYAEYSGSSKKVYPAGGATYVSSDYRTPSRPSHNGVDILRGDGKIYAVDAGTVVLAEEGCEHDSPYASCECNGGCGNHIAILHKDGYQSKYLHMKAGLFVKTGDKVVKGQQIGWMGSTGRSSAVHLHFSVLNPAGAYVSPNDYLGGEFAELPPQNVKLRLSKDVLQPYQPTIITYTASRTDFYLVHFYDQDGELIKTLNSKDESSEKSMTVSFGTPGQYSVRVDAYNDTGKANSNKMNIRVFDGAIDIEQSSKEMLKKARKNNRGKKRSSKKRIRLYDLHTIEKATEEEVEKPEVYATPSMPPVEKNDGKDKIKPATKTEKKGKKQVVLKKKGFEYRLIKKGSAIKVTRYLKKDKMVVIPAKIGGLPVKVVGRNTFVDENGVCKARSKIVISKFVEKLQDRIVLPDAKSFKVDKLNVNYSSQNGVLYNEKKTVVLRYPVLNMKSDKKHVKKRVYHLQEGVKKVARNAFKNATFEGYVLPQGLRRISARTFENNSKITKVAIPKTVRYIGVDAFSSSYNLERVDLYSKKMPAINRKSAVFSSAKVFVPKGSAFKRYDKLSDGGYVVKDRKGE